MVGMAHGIVSEKSIVAFIKPLHLLAFLIKALWYSGVMTLVSLQSAE